MSRSIYQLKISLEGSSPPIWRRILVSANLTLRQAHGVLQKALGTNSADDYRFHQDGREFGRFRSESVYLEDDSMFSLRYSLCQTGDTLGYSDGPWKYSIVLESIVQVEGRLPWRLLDGAGTCPPAELRIIDYSDGRRPPSLQ
jgi:hypothetical protein